MFIVKNGEICVPRAAGKLSVFALSDVCEGVSIRGAKYEVENVCITNAFPIGAGNDFRPDWLDGWCETKSVCVCGIKKKAGWRLRLTRPTGSRKRLVL